MLKDLNSETIKVVPRPEGFICRSKANISEVIMASFQGVKSGRMKGLDIF